MIYFMQNKQRVIAFTIQITLSVNSFGANPKLNVIQVNITIPSQSKRITIKNCELFKILKNNYNYVLHYIFKTQSTSSWQRPNLRLSNLGSILIKVHYLSRHLLKCLCYLKLTSIYIQILYRTDDIVRACLVLRVYVKQLSVPTSTFCSITLNSKA